MGLAVMWAHRPTVQLIAQTFLRPESNPPTRTLGDSVEDFSDDIYHLAVLPCTHFDISDDLGGTATKLAGKKAGKH